MIKAQLCDELHDTVTHMLRSPWMLSCSSCASESHGMLGHVIGKRDWSILTVCASRMDVPTDKPSAGLSHAFSMFANPHWDIHAAISVIKRILPAFSACFAYTALQHALRVCSDLPYDAFPWDSVPYGMWADLHAGAFGETSDAVQVAACVIFMDCLSFERNSKTYSHRTCSNNLRCMANNHLHLPISDAVRCEDCGVTQYCHELMDRFSESIPCRDRINKLPRYMMGRGLRLVFLLLDNIVSFLMQHVLFKQDFIRTQPKTRILSFRNRLRPDVVDGDFLSVSPEERLTDETKSAIADTAAVLMWHDYIQVFDCMYADCDLPEFY